MGYPGLEITGKACLIVAGSANPEKVAGIRRELEAIGDGHDAVQVDVADEQSVRRAVEETAAKFGRLDAVVNAAGVIKRQPSLEMTAAEFERIVRVNLTGSFVVAQAAGRVMMNQ